MASSSAPVHPYRYLTLFLVLLIGVYLLVFLTGDKHAKPKLGIDLQGGTRVTLTARTPDGSRPTRDALNQAQQIISARVNGLGVSGSEVVIDGDNLVITVPGNDGNEARNLGQTARLYIRPVIGQPIPVEAITNGGPGGPAGAPAGGVGSDVGSPWDMAAMSLPEREGRVSGTCEDPEGLWSASAPRVHRRSGPGLPAWQGPGRSATHQNPLCPARTSFVPHRRRDHDVCAGQSEGGGGGWGYGYVSARQPLGAVVAGDR